MGNPHNAPAAPPVPRKGGAAGKPKGKPKGKSTEDD